MERADTGQSEPVSRRTRPAKPALSRDAIVTAALSVLDADGLDTVSMRRVAQLLDTGPASLYVYVANREELLALLHDRVLGEVDVTITPGQDWRERLIRLIDDCIDALGRRRGIASVALAQIMTGPNTMAVAEALLTLLRAGGLAEQARSFAIDLIMLHVAAAAMEESLYLDLGRSGLREPEVLARVAQKFAELSAQRYPELVALRPMLFRGSGEQRRRWALEVLINGILATPVMISPRR